MSATRTGYESGKPAKTSEAARLRKIRTEPDSSIRLGTVNAHDIAQLKEWYVDERAYQVARKIGETPAEMTRSHADERRRCLITLFGVSATSALFCSDVLQRGNAR